MMWTLTIYKVEVYLIPIVDIYGRSVSIVDNRYIGEIPMYHREVNQLIYIYEMRHILSENDFEFIKITDVFFLQF